MANARVTLSLTPHELAIVQQAMRIFSEVIYCDITGTHKEIQFDGTLCQDNWNQMYVWVEEIRSSIGDGEPAQRHLPAGKSTPQPRQKAVRAPQQPRRKKKSVVAQAKKANRTAKRISRWLS